VFYTLRDGRIAEIREIMDTFDLVQQVLEPRRRGGAVGQEAGHDVVRAGYFLSFL